MNIQFPIESAAHPNRVKADSRRGSLALPAESRATLSIAKAFASGLGKDWTSERIERDCREVERHHD